MSNTGSCTDSETSIGSARLDQTMQQPHELSLIDKHRNKYAKSSINEHTMSSHDAYRLVQLIDEFKKSLDRPSKPKRIIWEDLENYARRDPQEENSAAYLFDKYTTDSTRDRKSKYIKMQRYVRNFNDMIKKKAFIEDTHTKSSTTSRPTKPFTKEQRKLLKTMMITYMETLLKEKSNDERKRFKWRDVHSFAEKHKDTNPQWKTLFPPYSETNTNSCDTTNCDYKYIRCVYNNIKLNAKRKHLKQNLASKQKKCIKYVSMRETPFSENEKSLFEEAIYAEKSRMENEENEIKNRKRSSKDYSTTHFNWKYIAESMNKQTNIYRDPKALCKKYTNQFKAKINNSDNN